ncbi:hypothetical protein M885DRAFT_533211 [Pelagophyceae sp. CCMP2097]|nr:hypothetical protein M885DRAFT_533211 [Pelagophyceae sp. CCMP2097]
MMQEQAHQGTVLKKLFICAALVLAAAGAAFGVSQAATRHPLIPVNPMDTSNYLKSSKERDCTFTECEQSGCAETNGHACFDDADRPGCAATAWTSATCKKSCTTANCADAVADDGVPSCDGVKCPKEDCTSQKCGAALPYRCIVGSAAPGCSDDPYGWALASPTLCSECCDSRTCK